MSDTSSSSGPGECGGGSDPHSHASKGEAGDGGKGGINCRAALQQLWAYLDEELSPEMMASVRTHLELCARCYPEYDLEKAFLQAIADCQVARCAPDELRRKVMGALKQAGFTTPSVTSA